MATKPSTPADIPVPPTATTSIKAAPDTAEGGRAEALRNEALEDDRGRGIGPGNKRDRKEK